MAGATGGVVVVAPGDVGIGDRIAVVRSGHAPGVLNGAGEVLDVLGQPGREVYRVRWLHGTETFYRPGADVAVLTAKTPGQP